MRLFLKLLLPAMFLMVRLVQAQEASSPSVYEVRIGEDGQRIYKSHAIAMHGQPKYGPDFTHFDYVNPDAPKGGTLRLPERGTFDSFNDFIPKGNAAGLTPVETLLESSADEAFTEYGLIAEEVAEVVPELVIYDADGAPYAVRYHLLAPMLEDPAPEFPFVAIVFPTEGQYLRYARAHGSKAGPDRVGAGNAGRGVGAERHRRRDE